MCRSARPTTVTVCFRPNGRLSRSSSPTRKWRCGLQLWPLTSTFPPRHAFWASERVRYKHATSSHTSRRTGAVGSVITRLRDQDALVFSQSTHLPIFHRCSKPNHLTLHLVGNRTKPCYSQGTASLNSGIPMQTAV